MLSTTITALALSVSLILIYKILIYPAFLFPLSNIPPAHPVSRCSNIWINYQKYRNNSNYAINSAHEKLGSIVRLGLKEISVNDVDALKIIYGGNWNKDKWYSKFGNYGCPNMFSMTTKKQHAERQRMFGNVYSKSAIYASETFKIIAQTLSSRILSIFEEGQETEIQGLLIAYANDFISAYAFGMENTQDLLRDEEARRKRLEAHYATQEGIWESIASWMMDGLLIFSGIRKKSEIKDECLEMLARLNETKERENAKQTLLTTKSIIHNQLLPHLPLPHHLASELKDHLTAGTETTSWTLTYILHQLSLNRPLQSRLRTELFTLHPSSTINATFLKTLDTLPLLHSIILETIRLSQLRISPPFLVTLCGYSIPPYTKVSAQAYSLHRNKEVFSEPELWRPERWMEGKEGEREEMMKWFWGFGSGARGCIGKDFAMLEMKILTWTIYGLGGFVTSVKGTEGLEQEDGYSVGPKLK